MKNDTEEQIVQGLGEFAFHLERGGSLREWKDRIELKKDLDKRRKGLEIARRFKKELKEFETWEEWVENVISRMFSYNEVFGPFPCEICGEEAWMIIVSEQEAEELPEGDRFDKSCYVFRNQLGTAICQKDLDKYVMFGKK
jgi:hypothetical protein